MARGRPEPHRAARCVGTRRSLHAPLRERSKASFRAPAPAAGGPARSPRRRSPRALAQWAGPGAPWRCCGRSQSGRLLEMSQRGPGQGERRGPQHSAPACAPGCAPGCAPPRWPVCAACAWRLACSPYRKEPAPCNPPTRNRVRGLASALLSGVFQGRSAASASHGIRRALDLKGSPRTGGTGAGSIIAWA